MNAGQILKASEVSALRGGEFLTNVTGRKTKIKTSKKWGSFGAAGFITVMIIFFLVIFGSGNIIPSALSERLIEETDVQYADAVESKKIVFQQALKNGKIPADTARILKNNGILVGCIDNDRFIETNQCSGELVLKIDDKMIAADDFIIEINSNTKLYDAFNKATYSRAAYWYDDAAKSVMQKIGTTRNNYNTNSDFDETMEKVIGSGSNMNVNNVALVKKTRINEQTGKEEIYYVYEETGVAASSKTNADTFIVEVGQKNLANSVNGATLNSADALKVADTMSKEQRSSLFFLAFMENISKMKAGEGNASKINEAMNYLYESAETEIVDIETGEIIKTTGTALESPSLYAILSGEKIDVTKVRNYSSDRVLKTVENQLGVSGSEVISGTVASSSNKVRGAIGRFVNSGTESASQEILSLVRPTISQSLMENSYSTIKGINAGEFMVEGAINVGKELAKASGATAGDAAAVTSYARLNNAVLAMDAKVDRMNRSPFDITSKNTFLGSIVYRIATLSASNSGVWFAGLKTIGGVISQSLVLLLPRSYADNTEGYLSNFGDCETFATAYNAVGSAQCAEIAVFDTSTLNSPFSDEGFINFVNQNTTLGSSGSRTINPNSVLANFILYNTEKTTPLGVIDGGILQSLNNGSSRVTFVSNILGMIKTWLSSSENNKTIASGAAFVNSTQNTDWQTYKYAQRYVSLARATAVLKQYTTDSVAYNNIEFFEGNENPVMAFLQDYYAMR